MEIECLIRLQCSGNRARRSVCRRPARNGAVVFNTEVLQIINAGFGRIARKTAFYLNAPFFSLWNNVFRLDGLNGDRTAHSRFDTSGHRRPFFYRNTAEQGGIDIVSVGNAVIVHPYVDGLFRSVNGNGDTAFSGDAADARRNRAARIARIHVVHAVEPLEDVAGGIGAVAFEVFFAEIGVGDVFAVLLRFTFLVFGQAFAADFDSIEDGGVGRGCICCPQVRAAPQNTEAGDDGVEGEGMVSHGYTPKCCFPR